MTTSNNPWRDRTYDAVPTNHANWVQMRAVMNPILGRRKTDFDKTRTIESVLELRRRFQARVLSLHEVGWSKVCAPPHAEEHGHESNAAKGRLQAMLHCYPTFVQSRPVNRLCGFADLCPFCWARRTASAWLRIEHGFFRDPRTTAGLVAACPPPPTTTVGRPVMLSMAPRPTVGLIPRNPNFDLVERRTTWFVPVAVRGSVHEGFPTWYAGRMGKLPEWAHLDRTREIKGLLARAAGRPTGVHEFLAVAPTQRDDLPHWQVVARQILLVPRGCPLVEADPPRWRVKSTRLENPSRRDVAAAVARAHRYPAFLLHPQSSTATIHHLLGLTAGRRLLELAGVFRRTSPSR